MSRRRLAFRGATTLTLAALIAANNQGAAAQSKLLAGCPVEVPQQFHKCALERAKTFNPPRTADGQPDMRGFWSPEDGGLGTGAYFPRYNLEGNVPESFFTAVWGNPVRRTFASVVIDPPDGRLPYTPAARAQQQENFQFHDNPKSAKHIDDRARCRLPGQPREIYGPSGMRQIMQTPDHVLMMTEFAHSYQIIPLNVRTHVPASVILWQGDSIGRWEGNTLVVDVTNAHGKWLDASGTFYSDGTQIVERWTLIDADTLHYTATIDDRKAFTRPWTVVFGLSRSPERDFELMEYACHEGERSVDNIAHAVK